MKAQITINVRHKLGRFAKLAVRTAFLCGQLNLPLPLRFLCFAVKWNSYVSVDHGPWKWTRIDLDPAEFA